jgi:hypothetical protein
MFLGILKSMKKWEFVHRGEFLCTDLQVTDAFNLESMAF